ncbi:hypothetical protein CHARACLAT_023643 [Characodon lateralis]|uniref:Uncharacterized protein n=1 Tax=Characodon lateralis TaxID=208331 RepID=A0ABU7EPZ4_9TELE|nr:hypothetical protein [Characodon lateralis]
MKEVILDIQARGMRENRVFSGTPARAQEDAESTVLGFLQCQLKLLIEKVKNIAFLNIRSWSTTSKKSRSEDRGTNFSVMTGLQRRSSNEGKLFSPIRKNQKG